MVSVRSFTVTVAGYSILLLGSIQADAAQKPISFKLARALGSGYRILAVSPGNAASSQDISGKAISIVPPGSTSRLYVLDSDSKVAYQVVNKYCIKGKKGKNKGQYKSCTRKDVVNTVFKAGAKLGKVKVLSGALLSSVSGKNYSKMISTSTTATAINYVPTGISTLGLGSVHSSSLRALAEHVSARFVAQADSADSDRDGLVAAVDSDDDGDGILDNYDSDTPAGSASNSSFKIFSNLKLDIDQSLNYQATGLDIARINTAIAATQTLALQVSGPETATVELDCGGLSYCSAGGTGTTAEGALPFPDSFDSDGDGAGTITRGSTGDFQLRTNASSSTIGAGDTYIQRVLDGSTESKIPGMLNFVFHSTPALKNLSYPVSGSDFNEAIDYSSSPIRGSRNNCIPVTPDTDGHVKLTLTGWRPQRPGNSAAGEGEYVDIGNSLITIDIPNGPLASLSGGGGGTSGPGNCSASAYSTTDANLSNDPNGLRDEKEDQDTAADNTFTFTVDLTTCLENAAGGAITWNATEYLFLDLQFRSSAGDNAAQKFCVRKAS
jgi:hypothetical protein